MTPDRLELWRVLLIVFFAGAVGGMTNALLTDNGFVLPRHEKSKDLEILRPGFLVNVFIGGVAACISWGLYGPFASSWIRGGPAQPPADAQRVGLTLAAFVGAVMVGVAGSRWLTNEIDKQLLRGAAVKAAKAPGDSELAGSLAVVHPAQAFKLAANR